MRRIRRKAVSGPLPVPPAGPGSLLGWREREVYLLWRSGESLSEIARLFSVTPTTVSQVCRAARRKLGLLEDRR